MAAVREVHITASKPMFGGMAQRIMGSVDIDGNGTLFDEVPDCDPFILADLIGMPKAEMMKAPFCAHPHSGACVMSVLMEGKEFAAWDNLRGVEKELLLPGGLYLLDSGRGGVHDEKPEAVSMRGVTKAVFSEGEDAAAEGFAFCQLWFNPGLEDTDAKPLSSQVLQPGDVPIVTQGALAVRVLAGAYGGVTSPLALPHPILLLHGRLDAGAEAELALPADHSGFIVPIPARSGEFTVDGALLPAGHVARLGAGAGALKLAAGEEGATFLLGVGVPHSTPFSKLLGFGGAVVEATPEKARARMEEYAADPQNFGRAADELPDLAADFSRYTMIEGYQDRGDGLKPGVEARWSPAEGQQPTGSRA